MGSKYTLFMTENSKTHTLFVTESSINHTLFSGSSPYSVIFYPGYCYSWYVNKVWGIGLAWDKPNQSVPVISNPYSWLQRGWAGHYAFLTATSTKYIETPSTRIRILLKPHTFWCESAYRPHESSESGHRNRILLLESSGYADSCGRKYFYAVSAGSDSCRRGQSLIVLVVVFNPTVLESVSKI